MSIVTVYTISASATGAFETREPIAADRIGSGSDQRTYPIAKLAFGAANSVTLVAADAPLPVTGPLTDAQLRASAVPVSGPLTDAQLRASAVPISGTVTASGPLTDTQLRATAVPVTGPLTNSELRASPVSVSVFNTPAVTVSGTATVSGPLTDAQLRATAVPVSGTVGISGSVSTTGPLTNAELRAAAVPVSGTVTASGPLTDAQLRAAAVPVSGTVGISGSVTTTGPLTDTQLRATPVPVSGTVTASGPLTDTQLRATPVPVSGTVTANGTAYLSTANLTRPNDTTAYAAGDEVQSSSPAILDFANIARSNGLGGVVSGATLVTSACPATAGSFELWLFDATNTPQADNAAFAPSDAVAESVVAVIPFSNTYSGDPASGGNRIYRSDPLVIPYTCTSTSLYGRIVVRNAYAPTANEKFTVRLSCQRD